MPDNHPTSEQTTTQIEHVPRQRDVATPELNPPPTAIDDLPETSAADYMAAEDADAVAQRLRELGYL